MINEQYDLQRHNNLCMIMSYVNVNQCQSKFFSVAKIEELLQSPQRHIRVTIQNQEMTVEKEIFLGIDGKQVVMEMTECQMAVSSIGVMQRQGHMRKPVTL